MRQLVVAFRIGLVLSLTTTSLEAGGLGPASGVSDALAAAFASAAEHQVAVVDARTAVDDQGRPTPEQPIDWQLAVPSAAIPALDGPEPAPSAPKLIILYVHGYNTLPAAAIQSSLRLWEMLHTVNDQMTTNNSVSLTNESSAFLVFLWRGYFTFLEREDFGAVKFSTAQKAADISARLFLNLISIIRHRLPRTKIVVLAHSLGARVALEAARESFEQGRSGQHNNQPLFDSLVLIQGAVRAMDLYKWDLDETSYVTSYGWDERGSLRGRTTTAHVFRHMSGKYADSIKRTRQLIFTCADNDPVLRGWFQRFGGKPASAITSIKDLSKGRVAIGSCVKTANETEIIMHPDPVDSDTVKRFVRKELRRYEWLTSEPEYAAIQPPSVLVVDKFTNWRIDHPNVSQINIAEKAPQTGLENWHSPLKDRRGEYIVSDIWRRVIEDLGR